MVEKSGFVMFLVQNNVISQPNDLPAATTLARSALNTVYDETLGKVKELLQQAPQTVGVTTDMWTDNYKKRSYMAVTVHFCSSDFRMHSVVLRTAVFSEAHTGYNIQAELENTCDQFGLQDKKLVYITDQGSNVVKACKLMGVERYGCVAHALHNLITVDGVSKCPELQALIVKVKNIVKTFTYKINLLESEAAKMADEQVKAELEKILSTIEDEEQYSTCETEDADNEEAGNLTSENRSSSSGLRPQSVSLKKDCPTRWNCLLLMLESVIKNQELIERCLSRLRLFEHMLNDEEWKTLENLVQFLKIFLSATEILSGATYPTVSLVLLFRTEIAGRLAESSDDCDIVRSIKQRMRAALDKRLPVTELHAIAAIMDPSQRNLITLQDYLTQRGTTTVDLLTEAIQKYVGVTDSSTTSSEFENQEVVDSASSRQWKRAKLELLSKHAGSAPSRAQEIQQFRCLSVSPDDVMTWWESQQNTYPNISKLARALLAIPATSVSSKNRPLRDRK